MIHYCQKYNGEMYNFEEINTISGERDEEEAGVGGMSASKMRKAAAKMTLSLSARNSRRYGGQRC